GGKIKMELNYFEMMWMIILITFFQPIVNKLNGLFWETIWAFWKI
ncbi:unnamed protein product, partial [marine sediment metagenome]